VSLDYEKSAFAKRLRESLKRARVDAGSSTHVAREFNLRYSGDPVSSQAVRKWLAGDSLPSQDKLRTLAMWLDVPAPWLRFGEPERRESAALTARQESGPYKAQITWSPKKFDALNHAHKRMVVEMVHALLRLEGKQ